MRPFEFFNPLEGNGLRNRSPDTNQPNSRRLATAGNAHPIAQSARQGFRGIALSAFIP